MATKASSWAQTECLTSTQTGTRAPPVVSELEVQEEVVAPVQAITAVAGRERVSIAPVITAEVMPTTQARSAAVQMAC